MPCGSAWGEGITLAWDANPEPTVAGYKVYSGTSSRTYSGNVDVGNSTNCFMAGLETGKTYYFAATDYSSTGQESGYSNEIVYTVPASCSFSLTPSSQTWPSSGGSGVVNVVTGSACNWATSGGTSWLYVTANSSGTGPGSVSFQVTANTTASSRSASLTVGGQTFTVTQSGYSSSYSVIASSNAGGNISPSGTSKLLSGESKTYTISPKWGYNISAVQVDGVSIGAVSTYTLTNITANHTIRAFFKKSRFF